MRPPVLMVVLAICSGTGEARAREPSRWTLEWTRGAGADACLSSSDLMTRVRVRLGRDPFFAPGRATYQLTGRIDRAPTGRWLLTLRILDRRGKVLGHRQISAQEQSCRDLDEALGLLVAMAVDTGALPQSQSLELSPPPLSPAASRPVSQPASRPTPGTRPAAASAPARTTARTRKQPGKKATDPPWRPMLGVGAVLDWGLLPEVAAGIELWLCWQWPRRFPLEISVGLWPPISVEAAGGTAGFWMLAAAAGLRPTFRLADRFRLRIAALIEAGALSGQGRGYDQDLASTQPVVNARLEPELQARIAGPLFGALGVGLVVPLIRDRFVIENQQSGLHVVHRPAPAGLRAGLRLGLRLP